MRYITEEKFNRIWELKKLGKTAGEIGWIVSSRVECVEKVLKFKSYTEYRGGSKAKNGKDWTDELEELNSLNLSKERYVEFRRLNGKKYLLVLYGDVLIGCFRLKKDMTEEEKKAFAREAVEKLSAKKIQKLIFGN